MGWRPEQRFSPVSGLAVVPVTASSYPQSNGKRVHVGVVERAIGKAIPKGAQVHHVDENKQNNSADNLVLCNDSAYHNLLHARQRALRECGDANARRCQSCGSYDRQEDLEIALRRRNDTKSQNTYERPEHRSCRVVRKEREREKIANGLVVPRGPNKNKPMRKESRVWKISASERTAIGKRGGAARAAALGPEGLLAHATKMNMAKALRGLS